MLAPAYDPSLTTTEVLGLLTACPYTQTNPSDCSLHEYRKLPLSELYSLIRHATSDELAAFVEPCQECPHRWEHCQKSPERSWLRV